MAFDPYTAARAVLDEDALMARKTKPIDAEWSQFDKDIVGRDVRITFHITRLMYTGGTVGLRAWAGHLRTLATELEAASARYDKGERSAMFDAKGALQRAKIKIGGRR